MTDFRGLAQALAQAHGQATVVPWRIRKAMCRAGWTNVRQSNVKQSCERRLLFTIQQEKSEMTVHALLGTVFHSAIEEFIADGQMPAGPNGWFRLFTMAREKDRNTVYHHQGTTVNMSHIKAMCIAMDDMLPDIIRGVVNDIDACGIRVIDTELRIVYEDAPHDKVDAVDFTGTIDIVGMMNGELVILDFKTTGLWPPIIAAAFDVRVKSAKKFDIKVTELMTSFQLRHYCWLYHKHTGKWPSFVGIVAPTNKTLYKRDSKYGRKGEPKGPSVFITQVPKFLLETYEADLVSLIKGIVIGGFFRRMPETYGVSDCPGCPYFEACILNPMSQTTSSTEYRESLDAMYNPQDLAALGALE